MIPKYLSVAIFNEVIPFYIFLLDYVVCVCVCVHPVVKEKGELGSRVVKTDFIQDYCNRGKEYRTGLTYEHSMGKWEFRAKEQDVGQWMKNY